MTDRQMLEYNALDAAITLEVARAFWKELRDGQYEDTYDFTIRLLNPLMFMQTRGIAVDRGKLKVVSEDVATEIIKKQQRLDELCGRALNPQSPKDCQKYFYVEKGIPPYTKRGTKGRSTITTDDKAMARIARGTSNRRGLPEAKLVQQLRGLTKLRGTYLEIEFDDDGRFRSSCNPRGTTTGRISTSKTVFDTGMNMQNLPPSFKRFLVPDPGYMFIELDKRHAEWVVVAYQCGDANMLKVVKENIDPHVHTAHLMFGVPKELIEKEDKTVGHDTDPDTVYELRKQLPELGEYPFVPRSMSMRQAGKKSNHGLNYDETYVRFALENEITEKEAKVYINTYFKGYRNIRINYESTQTLLRNGRTLTNCFGRRRTFLERWGQDLFKAAYAYIPQSTVADTLNWGIVKTYEDESGILESFEILAQVHDSVLLQVPTAVGREDICKGLRIIRDFLTPTLSYNGRDFEIETDIKASLTSWGDMEETDFTLREFFKKNELAET